MVAVIMFVMSVLIFIAELWLGFAVIGWQGEKLFIARSEHPFLYWMVMAFHFIVGSGLPLLAYAAGI